MTRISPLHAIDRKRMRPRMIIQLVVLAAMTPCFMPVPVHSASKRSGITDNVPAKIQSEGLTDPVEFAAFLDPLVDELMTANHIPGGAIAVVKDGQIFYAKGYGFADLERRTPATADTTIFRTGSVSKVFTWTAVMQLVEQGRLGLNADVNTYLTHFQIPANFAQPITLSHLMTHTAGFEDQISNGMLYASPDAYKPLQDFLMEKMPARVFPPGWVQVAPLVFQEAGSQSLLAFRTDTQGQVTAMFHGDQPILVLQRLAWYEDPQKHLAGLGLALLVFIVTGLVWSVGTLLRLVRRKPISTTRLENWSRLLAGGLILLNLVIVGLVISVLVGDGSFVQFGYPTGFSVAGTLALLSAAGAIVLLACTAGVWRERAWGVVGRLHYTLVAAAALYFVFYLIVVNILQFQL